MHFSTLMALAAATGTNFALAAEAAHPPVYSRTGVPHNGSHPIFPTGTGRPSGIIGTGFPTTTRHITKPVTTSALSTSTCTEEESEPTTTITSVTHPTETDTVSGNLPFPTVSLPSGINTQIASSDGGEFSTFTSLPGGYGAPSSVPGGYGKPSSVPGGYGKPSSVASSLGSESSPPGGYGKPITIQPSRGFPTHTLNHTVFPSGTGRPHSIHTGVSSIHRTSGTGVHTKSTASAPGYGKPKPTPIESYVKRDEESDAEEIDDCTTSSHIPKHTATGFPGHFPSGVASPSGRHGRPSGVAHSSGHKHHSGVAKPTNMHTKSFETRTKTKSVSETHSHTKEAEPTMY